MIKQILVIDDDEIFRLTASLTLKKAFPGVVVLFAKHGEEALFILKDNLPDVILLDLNMPVMDGWDFLNAAISIPLPPIYIVSSSIDPNDKKKAMVDIRVKGFIEKPLNVEKVAILK